MGAWSPLIWSVAVLSEPSLLTRSLSKTMDSTSAKHRQQP